MLSSTTNVEKAVTAPSFLWGPAVGEKVQVFAGPSQFDENLKLHITNFSELSVEGTSGLRCLTPKERASVPTANLFLKSNQNGNMAFTPVKFLRIFRNKKKKKKSPQVVFVYGDANHPANEQLRAQVYGKYLNGLVLDTSVRGGKRMYRVRITTTMKELAVKHRGIANGEYWFERHALRPDHGLVRLEQKGGKKGKRLNETLIGDHDSRLFFISQEDRNRIADMLALPDCGPATMDVLLRYPLRVLLHSVGFDRTLDGLRDAYDRYDECRPYEREQVQDYLRFTCTLERGRMRIVMQKRDSRIHWGFRIALELIVATAQERAGACDAAILEPLRDDWTALCDHGSARSEAVVQRMKNIHEVRKAAFEEAKLGHAQLERKGLAQCLKTLPARAAAATPAGPGPATPSPAASAPRAGAQVALPKSGPGQRACQRTSIRVQVLSPRGDKNRTIVLRSRVFPTQFPRTGPTDNMLFEFARVGSRYHQSQFAGQIVRILVPRPGVCYDALVGSGVKAAKCIKLRPRDIDSGALQPLDKGREEMMLDAIDAIQAGLRKVASGGMHPCQFTFDFRQQWERNAFFGDDLRWMTDGTALVKIEHLTVSIQVQGGASAEGDYRALPDGLKFKLTAAARALVEDGFNGSISPTTALGMKILKGRLRPTRPEPRDAREYYAAARIYEFTGTVRVMVQSEAADRWETHDGLHYRQEPVVQPGDHRPRKASGSQFQYKDGLTGRTHTAALVLFDAERIDNFRKFQGLACKHGAATARLPPAYLQRLQAPSFLSFREAVRRFERAQMAPERLQPPQAAQGPPAQRRSASSSPTPDPRRGAGMEPEPTPGAFLAAMPAFVPGQRVAQLTPVNNWIFGTVELVLPNSQLPRGEPYYTVLVHQPAPFPYMCDQGLVGGAGQIPLFSAPIVPESQLHPASTALLNANPRFPAAARQPISIPYLCAPEPAALAAAQWMTSPPAPEKRRSDVTVPASDHESSDDELPAETAPALGGVASVGSDNGSDGSTGSQGAASADSMHSKLPAPVRMTPVKPRMVGSRWQARGAPSHFGQEPSIWISG